MRRAFTLIELLVVIAIIAVLAAILFPVFAQVKQAAKKTACLSNLKQIGTAVMLYQADYDDGYPNTDTATLWIGRQFRWPIMPYLALAIEQNGGPLTASSSSALLSCPSDTSSKTFDSTSYAYAMVFYRSASVFPTLTLRDLAVGGACTGCSTFTTSQVAQPSQKVLLFEYSNSHRFEGKPVGPWGSFSTAGSWTPGPDRWTGSRTLGFADGHAAFVAATRMTASRFDTPDPNVTPGGLEGSDLK